MADPTTALAVPQAVLTDEVATVRSNPFEITFNGLMRPRDATLATRGGSRGIWIYDEIERDGKVFSSMQKRKLAVVGREWRMEAASDAPEDIAARDLVQQAFASAPFDLMCLHLLDAILKGYAVSEIIWGVVGKNFLPVDLKDRDAKRFVFDEFWQTRMLTWGNLLAGVPVPERKFIVHRYGAKDGNPYGLGLGTRLFWPALFKRQSIQFWLTFADKFGNPTPVGTYPAGASQEQKDTLMEALAAIANDVGVIVPEGMAIKLLEALKSSGGDYKLLLDYFNNDIEEIVLGESLSSGSQRGDGLGGGRSVVKNEIRLELVKSDADLLAGALNSGVVRWIVELNLPNAKPPRIWWDCKEGEDLKLRAERDEILLRIGYRLRLDAVKQIYGDFYDFVQPSAPPAPPSLNPADPLAFAEALSSNPSLAQTESLQRASQPALKKMLEPVIQLVEGASSLVEIRDRLDKLFPRMDSHSLALLMGEAIAASHLAGRHKVKQES